MNRRAAREGDDEWRSTATDFVANGLSDRERRVLRDRFVAGGVRGGEPPSGWWPTDDRSGGQGGPGGSPVLPPRRPRDVDREPH